MNTIKNYLFMFTVFTGAFLMMLVFAGPSMSMTFADGKISLNGFYKNWTGYRFGAWGEERGDGLSIFRNTLQLETEIQLKDRMSFVGIYRFSREPAYELEEEAREAGNFDADILDESDFREYYLDWQATRRLWFGIGKQQVVWGDLGGLGLRVMDIINPLDLTWHYSLEAFEDIRKPLHMLNAIVSIPEIQANVQLVWVPGLEDTQQRVNSIFTNPGHRWGLNNVSGINQDDPGFFQKGVEEPDPFEGDAPGITRDIEDDSTVAIRFQKRSGNITWAVMDAYTHNHSPTVYVLPSGNLKIEHRRQNVFGVSANMYDKYTNGVWRFEAGHFHDTPYTGNMFQLVEEDTYKFGIGYDRNTFFDFLSPTRSVLTQFQILGTYIPDDDDIDVRTSVADQVNESLDIMYTLFINWGWNNDRTQINLYPAYNFDRDFGMIQAWIDWRPSEFGGDLKITPKVNLLYGDDPWAGDFGFVRGCTEGLLEITYEF